MMEAYPNLLAAWTGFLLGIVSGVLPGLLFHDPEWMGGYGSWRRRLVRLGHISFFGIGFLNVSFALTTQAFERTTSLTLASWFFIVGAVTMPVLCYLSAWKKFWRHLFFIPVTSLGAGVILTIYLMLSA